MRGIHEYYMLIHKPGFHTLTQYLLEYLLKQVGVLESSYIILSKRTEMRYGVMQPETEKPAIRIVHLYFLDRLPHTPYSKHVLHNG